ncbi:MAG TPA: hypothetical protein VFC18_16955 [Burkholderiales bacterium]|nr:hypothetical protein [Burkholderiales bacterium]
MRPQIAQKIDAAVERALLTIVSLFAFAAQRLRPEQEESARQRTRRAPADG